jgi:hypothetical protein
MLLPRHLEPIVLESLAHFPAVLVVGARQVGKSTLVQAVARKGGPSRYLTLDDRTILDAALTNADGLIAANPGPIILDEIQRAPDLLRAIKLVIDRDRAPGRFLLTGSANVLTLSSVSETLAGRVAVHELHPLSWSEIVERPLPLTIDSLFRAENAAELMAQGAWKATRDRTAEIQRQILRGGFPTPALLDSDRARRTWFDSYRQTYIERDLRDLAQIASLPEFSRLMTTLALRTGQMLNASELSRDIGLPVTTLRRYLQLLAQTYQATLLPPFSANLAKRLVKTPKVYLEDSGVACALSAVDTWATLERQHRVGAMLETWLAAELRKLIALGEARTTTTYWRTRAGEEVDFLLERGGSVVGIEAKWTRRFTDRDLAGLRSCGAALGRRWRMGVLAHTGTETVALDERTIALPFSLLLGRDG